MAEVERKERTCSWLELNEEKENEVVQVPHQQCLIKQIKQTNQTSLERMAY